MGSLHSDYFLSTLPPPDLPEVMLLVTTYLLCKEQLIGLINTSTVK